VKLPALGRAVSSVGGRADRHQDQAEQQQRSTDEVQRDLDHSTTSGGQVAPWLVDRDGGQHVCVGDIAV
jgi:hypothetical protein